MRADAVQLKFYDPKDTLACLARPSEVELALFAENPTISLLRITKGLQDVLHT
jgi:hypothetical protein